MTTTTERITSAVSSDGRYACYLETGIWFENPLWLVMAVEGAGAEMFPHSQPDAPGLDAQIVLDRFLATLTRCAICDSWAPDEELASWQDGENAVSACRACRGEE